MNAILLKWCHRNYAQENIQNREKPTTHHPSINHSIADVDHKLQSTPFMLTECVNFTHCHCEADPALTCMNVHIRHLLSSTQPAYSGSHLIRNRRVQNPHTRPAIYDNFFAFDDKD